MLDRDAIERAVAAIITAIGEDTHREGLRDTPQRIAQMYAQIFSGIHLDPKQCLTDGYEEGYEGLVIVKAVPFYSMCEHHFLPFHGLAHIGYIPKGRVVGASQLAAVVETLAKRPQLQERLTTQVADTIAEALQPQGVAVALKAEHLCMTMRETKRPGSYIITTAYRGCFQGDEAARKEFLSLVGEK